VLVGCRRPPRLLVLDAETGRQTASIEIPGDTDDVFYDAASKRVYAICGEGAIAVLRQDDADHYRPEARLPTAPGARTGLFVPEWRRLFVAVPHRGAQQAEIRAYDAAP
jgi:hypothetical protein